MISYCTRARLINSSRLITVASKSPPCKHGLDIYRSNIFNRVSIVQKCRFKWFDTNNNDRTVITFDFEQTHLPNIKQQFFLRE